MKKALSVILAIVIMVSVLPLSLTSGADTSGYYTYEIIDEIEVSIISVDTSISGNITIPSTLGGYSVTTIGWYAFEGCSAITGVTIPSGIQSISNDAFVGCSSLSTISVDANNPVYFSKGNCIIEKDTKQIIIGCKNSVIPTDGSATSIGWSAFEGCNGITSISIPSIITKIDDCAFQNCENLSNITLHDNISYIGSAAFYNTAYYNNDNNWSNGVLYVGNYLIENNGYVPTNYTIRNGTVAIMGYAFAWCEDVTSITIPNTVKSIGYEAFYGCIGLTSITIPSSVKTIEWSAFQDCTGLKTISIHDGVEYIGEDAFNNTAFYNTSSNWINGVLYLGNHLIKAEETISGTYSILDGVVSISSSAFSYCSSLTGVTIPNSVKSVGEAAFYECTALASITIPNSVKTIGDSAFEYCTGLASIVMGDGVTNIEEGAFKYCTGLTDISFGKNVLSIGDWAFEGCEELVSVTIPKSVTNIGWGAFYDCNNVTDVYYDSTEADWANIQIGDANSVLETANIHCVVIPEEPEKPEIPEESETPEESEVKPTIVYGDVNGDKKITAEDALEILQVTVDKRTFTEEQRMAGNVDGDSEITATDALLVLQYSVDKINKFPVSK